MSPFGHKMLLQLKAARDRGIVGAMYFYSVGKQKKQSFSQILLSAAEEDENFMNGAAQERFSQKYAGGFDSLPSPPRLLV